MSICDFILSVCIFVCLFILVIYKSNNNVAYEYRYDPATHDYYSVEVGI